MCTLNSIIDVIMLNFQAASKLYHNRDHRNISQRWHKQKKISVWEREFKVHERESGKCFKWYRFCVCVCVCVCAQAWSICTRPDRKNSHENFCILLSVININADISTTELETNCESGRDWDWKKQAKKMACLSVIHSKTNKSVNTEMKTKSVWDLNLCKYIKTIRSLKQFTESQTLSLFNERFIRIIQPVNLCVNH